MKKKLCVLIALVLFTLTPLVGCTQVEPEATPTPLPTPIVPEKPTYVVQRGAIVRQVEFLARVAPVEEYQPFFRMGGYIKEVHVARGDEVKVGDVLAELDVEDMHKQLAQSRIALESVDLKLVEAEKANEERVADAQTTLDRAELRLSKLRAQDPSKSEALAKQRHEEQITDARINLDKAELRLARLRAQDPSSEKATQQREERIADAKISLEKAELRLAKLQAQDPSDSQDVAQQREERIADAKINLEKVQLRLAKLLAQDPSDSVAIARLRMEQTFSTLKSAQAAYDRRAARPGVEASSEALQLQSATLAYEIAQTQHNQALQGQKTYGFDVKLAEKDEEVARLALERLEESTDAESTYEYDVKLAEKDVEVARLVLERLEAATDPGVTYKYDLALAEKDVELSRLALERLEQDELDPNETYQYDLQLAEMDVQVAKLALERLEEGVDPQLVKEVETIQLSVDRMEAQVQSAQLTAPIDGVVMSISVYAGRAVAAFKPAAVIADNSKLELSANLQSSMLQDLQEEMECIIRLSHRPGEEWAGQIRLLPFPYGTGGSAKTVDEQDKSTRVSFDVEQLELEEGDLAKVFVVLERKEGVLSLPPQAIRSFEGRKFVLIQEGDKQRRMDVKLGIRSEDKLEILEGVEGLEDLKEGMIIIGL